MNGTVKLLLVMWSILALGKSMPFDPSEDLDQGEEAEKISADSFVDLENSVVYHHNTSSEKDPLSNNVVKGSFDGDELLTNTQKQELETQQFERRKFGDLSVVLWPEGIIPYKFNAGSRKFKRLDSYENTRLAIAHIEKWTCLDFIDIDDEPDEYEQALQKINHRFYIDIGTGDGCSSYIGYTGSLSYNGVYLDEEIGCTTPGVIVHELGHALGFFHEHSRSDRDEFVIVNWQNIESVNAYNFEKTSTENLAPYDYASTMHYSSTAFSRNDRDTVSAKDPMLNFLMGRRSGLSFYDVQAINTAYKCAAHCPSYILCENGSFLLKSCDCLCPRMFSGFECLFFQPEKNPTLNQEDCDKSVYIEPGNVHIMASPGYPGAYSRAQCANYIKSPKGTRMNITLYIDLLPRDPSTHECYDWLELRYTLIGQMGPRLCGENSFHRLITNDNWFLAIFDGTDPDYYGRGFMMMVGIAGDETAYPKSVLTTQTTKPTTSKTEVTTEDVTQYICWNGGTLTSGGCACPAGTDGNSCDVIKYIDCTYEVMTIPHSLCAFKQWPTPKDSGDWTYDNNQVLGVHSDDAPMTAVLQTHKILHSQGSKCITISYKLAYEGRLGLTFMTNTTDVIKNWVPTGAKAGVWNAAFFTVESREDFEILVNGSVSGSSYQKVAMKLFRIEEGVCRETKSVPVCMLAAGHHIPEKPSLRLPFLCDFDDGPCSFNVVNGGWTRTKNLYTGPFVDHTPGQGGRFVGHFAVYRMGSPSQLVSPTLHTCAGACVSFWYYVCASMFGELSMLIQTRDTLDTKWTLEINKFIRVDWTRVSVYVDVKSEFQVVFRHKKGPYWGSFAIDDIKVTVGRCT